VGADGSVWIVGTNPFGTEGDFGIHRWAENNWVGVEGGGVRIDVDPSGNPWMVNAKGEIFRRVKDKWERLPGHAKDIGVGADGTVWIIGTNPFSTEGDFGPHRWAENDWLGVEGGGVQISVDKSGLPWMVNSMGNIFRRQ
ncbi:MAG TPA: tectonin domain-containing protein, partial [Terrimicrobiaceae bacterium]